MKKRKLNVFYSPGDHPSRRPGPSPFSGRVGVHATPVMPIYRVRVNNTSFPCDGKVNKASEQDGPLRGCAFGGSGQIKGTARGDVHRNVAIILV